MNTNQVLAKRPRSLGSMILRWVVTLGLLLIVASQVEFRQFATIVQDVKWWWVALAVACAFVDRVIATIRWWMLLRVKQIDIGFMPLLNLHLAANFVGSFLPTSFGADAARIVMLSRRTGMTMQTIAASATDRLLMIGTTVSVAMIVSAIFVQSYLPASLQWSVFAAGGFGVALSTSVVVVGRMSFVQKLSRTMLGEPIFEKLAVLYWSICEYRHHRLVLFYSLGLSALMLILRAVVMVLMARAFGVMLPLSIALLLWPILSVVLMLPISIGNFGLQEGSYVALLSVIGISATLAVSISLLDHIIARAVVLPGAFLWLWSTSRANRAIDPMGKAEHING